MTRRDSSGSEEIQWGNGHPQSRRNACGRLTTKVLTNSIFKYRSLSLWNDERAIGVLQKTYVSHVLKSLFVIWEPSSATRALNCSQGISPATGRWADMVVLISSCTRGDGGEGENLAFVLKKRRTERNEKRGVEDRGYRRTIAPAACWDHPWWGYLSLRRFACVCRITEVVAVNSGYIYTVPGLRKQSEGLHEYE